MAWQPVLRTSALSTATPRTIVEYIGEVTAIPNPFTPYVTVRLHAGDEERAVHLPWSDRPEGLGLFLSLSSDTFRLHAGICAQSVVALILYVNTRELERQFFEHGAVAGEPFVAALLHKFLPDASLPKTDPPLEHDSMPHPRALRVEWTLPLRAAQRASVDWLHAVEREILEQGRLAYPTCVPLTPRLNYDMRASLIVRQDHGESEARFRGCVLANDTGSGKTCCCMRLLAEQGDVPVQAAHADILFSNATVVICPVGMQNHWRDEARKFAPGLRVVMLTSAREVKVSNLQTLIDGCDLVITTPTWIRSKTNTELTDTLVGAALDLEPDKRLVRKSFASAARTLRRKADGGLQAHPAALGVVTFRRCIIDEAHDVLGASSAKRERLRACRCVNALAWLGLTATPNIADATALQEWMGLLLDADEGDTAHPCLSQQVERLLIRSFTNEGVVDTQHREVTRTVHRIVLSAFERALLELHADASDITRTVQLCSSTGAHFHNRVHSVEDVVQTLRAAQEEECIEGDEHAVAYAHRQNAFLERMFTHLSAPAMECPVCFRSGVGPSTPWVALGCGHVFCDACHARLAPSNGASACPTCREPIERAFRVAVAPPSEMLRSRGAKLDAAAELLKSVAPAKALVVATWKPLLLSLKEVLQESGTAAEILEGPATRRAAVVRRFREAVAPSALLLLSHGGFEGHDLTEASHIVFMHALTDSSEALRIEHQVLGRVLREDTADAAAVHVHHLIAADTDEERLWNRQHEQA